MHACTQGGVYRVRLHNNYYKVLFLCINNRIDSYKLQCYFFLLLYNVQKLNKILFLFLLRRRMHAWMVATMMIKNADNKAIEIANKLHRK